jgi:hypothetical protein
LVKFDYLPSPNLAPLEWPEEASWSVAKASAQLALLPRDEARMYDFLYSDQAVMKERVYAYSSTLDALRRFESRFANLEASEAEEKSPIRNRKWRILITAACSATRRFRTSLE